MRTTIKVGLGAVVTTVAVGYLVDRYCNPDPGVEQNRGNLRPQRASSRCMLYPIPEGPGLPAEVETDDDLIDRALGNPLRRSS